MNADNMSVQSYNDLSDIPTYFIFIHTGSSSIFVQADVSNRGTFTVPCTILIGSYIHRIIQSIKIDQKGNVVANLDWLCRTHF